MPTSFYDVVVLGTHLEPLLCAALLAREGLRVLVLGQGTQATSYAIGDVRVDPYIFQPLGVQSPAVRSALDLLALRQDVRQQMRDDEPPMQLLLDGHRLSVDPDSERWLGEIHRELPRVLQQASDITRTLSEVRGELDVLMGRNLAWPPESFLERQLFSFAASVQRYDRLGQGWTSWNQLAHRHPLRIAFEALLPHASGLLPRQHSDMTRARLHAHVLSGTPRLGGGWPWLRDALVARVRSWGGDVRERDRVDAIHPGGRRSHSLLLSRTSEEVGCAQIVFGAPVGECSQLLPDRGALASIFERVGEPRSRAYRCSVNVLVERSVLPPVLAPLSLHCGSEPDATRAFLLRTRAIDDERALVTTNTLVDEHLIDTTSSPLGFVREDAMEALRHVIPFVDDHLFWIDSPHDGLPPRAARRGVDVTCSEPWMRGPHTMKAVYEYPTRRALGACALPTRTPVRGLFLCNEQVAPGLGFEGSFLAATTVAHSIATQYRTRDWLRRGPWAERSV